MDGTEALRRMEAMDAYLEWCARCENPDLTPEILAPAAQFLLIWKSDDRLVGMLQVRQWEPTLGAAFVELKGMSQNAPALAL